MKTSPSPALHASILSFTAAGLLWLGLANQTHADRSSGVVAVDFTPTPLPATDAERVRTYTRSKVRLRHADGSVSEHPLAYRVLFTNRDRVGKNGHPAGQVYDVEGKPVVDPNGDPVIAETPDANSLLKVADRLFLVTHYEYDWMLENGAPPERVPGWYPRMAMSMTLTRLEQAAGTGELRVVGQRPIDFSSVDGLWIPCFGSQTPWNTHLGSEEDYDLYLLGTESGEGPIRAAAGLRALTEIYFKGKRQANPYHYGFIPEVRIEPDGTTQVVKHYNLGRATWEQALVMPDQRTVYLGDDGDHVGLFMFLADRAADLSAGTLYAARWRQTTAARGGAARLDWIRLGHATRAQAKTLIDSGVQFDDIFTAARPDAAPRWQEQGFRAIRAGHSGNEYLKLKPDREQAALVLETRRYAAYLGATTEFNKMEGLAVDPAHRQLFVAMSYVDKGMLREEGAPADHIRLDRVMAGGTYRIELAADRSDTEGRPIDSAWVGLTMQIPPTLLGVDTPADALGNLADPDRVANPDNLFFSQKMRTLFIAEDSATHVNNFLWAYQVDSAKLTRILSLASGAESSGLQVIDNLGGHGYILSNAQHQGEWIPSLPTPVKSRLIAAATTAYGITPKGVLNYYLTAPIGYISGMPGL